MVAARANNGAGYRACKGDSHRDIDSCRSARLVPKPPRLCHLSGRIGERSRTVAPPSAIAGSVRCGTTAHDADEIERVATSLEHKQR